MAFCSKCGYQLTDHVEFCSNCGTSVCNEAINEYSERKTVYDGKIHKCPNCGEVLSSFVAICPACKFEIEGRQPSSSLKQFILEVEKCESEIMSAGVINTGWSSWNNTKRFWWVFLNVFFVCLPLAIYFVSQSLLMKLTPKLTNEEKGLASLVENFLFPNDRESIIEGLVFAKEKILFISNQTINRKNAYWMRLWRTKAEQFKQKADILFPGDAIVALNYSEILKTEDRISNVIQTKRVVSWIAIGIFTVFCIVSYFFYSPTDNSFEWKTEGLYAQLPEPTTSMGEIVVDNEQQLKFELHGITKAGFEQYVSDCVELGFLDNLVQTDFLFSGADEDGYLLSITYFEETKVMNITINSFSN